MAQLPSDDMLADFAHQLRQPLSALEALAFYLDLIARPEDAQVHQQLRRIHAEIANADQVLCDGLCALRAYLLGQRGPVLPDVPAAAEPKVTPHN